MAAGDVIYAENLGENPLVWKWANQKYTLQPHLMTIVPWEAMVLYMGNPDFVDIDDRQRYRTDELKRLYFKHGAHDGDPLKWEANKPKVVCKTLDDELIITVVDDPDGEHLTPDISTKAQNQMLQQRMQRLEAELRSLRRAGRTIENEESATSAATAVTEDSKVPIEQQIQVFEGEVPKPDKVKGPRSVTEDTPTAIPSEVGS